MKLVTVVGARPQFIKASALSRAIDTRSDIEEVLVHTGQHYDDDMSDIFFRELGIPRPRYSLDISGGQHGAMTGRMLASIESLLVTESPDALIVYGDTNSTLAAALAASKLNVPIAHIEAGLRSFNRRMPEEINRVVADHLSHWLLCPTETAVANLALEGIVRNVCNVGDIMFDVARSASKVAARKSVVIERLNLAPHGYILATVHRQENTDDIDRLGSIMRALDDVGRHLPVVLPVHPRTRERMESFSIRLGPNIRCLPPVSYLDMVRLESDAALIATDSGGVQKEAYFHGIPCVTLRDETEWVELVESGWNILASPLATELPRILRDAIGTRGTEGLSLYGSGNSAELILQALVA